MVINSSYPVALLCLFFAITFLQSSIDKLANKEGNLSWFKSVFEKTFIGKIITPLFYWITIQEIALGSYLLYAIVAVFSDNKYPAYIASTLSLFLLIQLFAGQRIAKDYEGASGIVPYIIVALIGLFLIP